MAVRPHQRAPVGMFRSLHPTATMMVCIVACFAMSGCGTTRWSDSARTATEQLLITDAIDEAVQQLNFSVLADQEVYFDDEYLAGSVDENYLISSLRQHMLASGCILKENREDAKLVIEARSGAVGTDRHDVMIGVPSVNVPTFLPSPVALPASIPEIPLAKNTKQRGVVKLAVFAYNRETGRRVWQSGIEPVSSFAKDSWVMGAGPFRKSTINDGTSFVGDSIPIIGESEDDGSGDQNANIALSREKVFRDGLTSPEAAAEVQLAGQISNLPAEKAMEVPSSPNTPTAGAGIGMAQTPRLMPYNPAAVPMEASSEYAVPQTSAASSAYVSQQMVVQQPHLAAADGSVVVDDRFAPRRPIETRAPQPIEVEEVAAAEPQEEGTKLAESRSPLERLWPGYWFKRNHSHGGQAAD